MTKETGPAASPDETWCEVFNLNVEMSSGDLDIFSRPQDNDEYFQSFVSAKLTVDDSLIGHLNGRLLRADLLEDDGQNDVLTAFDDIAADVGEIAACLFEEGGGYLEDVLDEHEPMGKQILYLETMTIEPAFRGHGFGLAILQHALRHCPHDLVIIKPHPLQHGFNGDGESAASDYPEFRDVPLKVGKAKLAKYYKKIGFTRLGKTDFWVRSNTRPHKWLQIEVSEEDLRRLRVAAKSLKKRRAEGSTLSIQRATTGPVRRLRRRSSAPSLPRAASSPSRRT